MSALAILAASLPVATAWLLLGAQEEPRTAARVWRFGLALVLGGALAGLLAFGVRVLEVSTPALLGADVLLCTAAALTARGRRETRAAAEPTPPWTVLDCVLLGAVTLAALAAAAAVAANVADIPHGEWDAWAIWNLRARALVRGPVSLAFDPAHAHADYPPLLPALIAHGWLLTGEGVGGPLAVAGGTACALVLLLGGGLALLRDRTVALLAVLALLGTPAFLKAIAWQYADLPLATLILATLALLAGADHAPGARAPLVWAGACAGLAPLVKNEGLLFLAVLVAARAVVAWRERGNVPPGRWRWFAAGAALPLAVLAGFKLGTPARNYLFAGQTAADWFARLLSGERWVAIGTAVGTQLVLFGGVLLIALVAAAVLLGPAPEPAARRDARRAAAVVALMVVGFALVYAVTPEDLEWQLRFSVERLLLQLWPAALFALFLGVRSPNRGCHRGTRDTKAGFRQKDSDGSSFDSVSSRPRRPIVGQHARRMLFVDGSPPHLIRKENAMRRLVPLLLVLALAGCDRVLQRQVETALTRETGLLEGDDMTVILCGTGSPLPDPDRAGACTAVFAGGEFVLVDSGSGSWENLDLAHLPTGALSAVLLTHFHSDHIGDLGETITQSWIAGRKQPLDVYGPPGTKRVVDGFVAAYAQDADYRTAHHSEQYMPRAVAPAVAHEVALGDAPDASAVVFDRNGLRVTMFNVDHDPVHPAVGYRFDYRGNVVVVSGDTKKSASVQAQAANADLLIHEALNREMIGRVSGIAKDLGHERIGKLAHDTLDYHTSPVEAAEIARDAQVQTLVFTHVVPGPRNAIMRRMFLDGVDDVFTGEVVLGEDGQRFVLKPK